MLIDEFQNIPLKKNESLYTILREARKFKFQIILSSQYISNYSPDELNALLQVGTTLYFKPTSRDTRMIAGTVCEEKACEWRKILQTLGRGEAVLKGNYRIKGKSRLISTPIVVKVAADRKQGVSVITCNKCK